MQNEPNRAAKVSRLALASFIMAVSAMILFPFSIGLLVGTPHNPNDFNGIMLGVPLIVSFLLIIAGLPIGIGALVRVRRSEGRLLGKGYAVAGIVVTALMIVSILAMWQVMRMQS